MSRENVETVRRLLDAYNDGDYESSIEALDPDVELWVDPEVYPDAGLFRGREAVVSWFMDWVESFDDYWAETDELTDAGDWVLAVLHSGGRGRASGAPATQAWIVAYRCVGGKAARLEFHPNTERAMKAIVGAQPET